VANSQRRQRAPPCTASTSHPSVMCLDGRRYHHRHMPRRLRDPTDETVPRKALHCAAAHGVAAASSHGGDISFGAHMSARDAMRCRSRRTLGQVDASSNDGRLRPSPDRPYTACLHLDEYRVSRSQIREVCGVRSSRLILPE
jgi:hypothetical protein